MSTWPAPKPTDRYILAEWGREYGDDHAKLTRMNDGSLVIRAVDDDSAERLTVSRHHDLPRKAPYDTPDDDQLAFALRVLNLLNGAAP